MADPILGDSSYLVLMDETEWGQFPGASGSGSAGNYYHIPVENYSVRFKPENRQANPFTGNFQRKHSSNYRGMPSGQLVTSLYGWLPTNVTTGGLAKKILDWAFADYETAGGQIASKSAEWAQGPNVDNLRHTGLRVNQATLTGSDGAAQLQCTLDLMGCQELAGPSAQTLPTNRNKLAEFEFPDCTFKLGGVTVAVKAFTWTVQNNLQVHYLNKDFPQILVKTDRVETLGITLVHDANTYSAYRRLLAMTEFTGEIAMQGLHNGTGGGGTNYTKAVVTFNRLSFVDADEQGGRNDVLFQPLKLIALKPDTSSNASSIAYSEV